MSVKQVELISILKAMGAKRVVFNLSLPDNVQEVEFFEAEPERLTKPDPLKGTEDILSTQEINALSKVLDEPMPSETDMLLWSTGEELPSDKLRRESKDNQ